MRRELPCLPGGNAEQIRRQRTQARFDPTCVGPMSKTVIVGGGIAGLATAFYLQQSGLSDFTLIECSPHWGGKITSAVQDGFLVEGGPDSFITQKAAAMHLCARLGLSHQFAGPLMGGIHAADPEKLSLQSTFPMFQEMEKKHGSLLRGMMKRLKRRAAPGAKATPMFMSLRGGLQQLADALIAQLPPQY